jgi:hypothetical protein
LFQYLENSAGWFHRQGARRGRRIRLGLDE